MSDKTIEFYRDSCKQLRSNLERSRSPRARARIKSDIAHTVRTIARLEKLEEKQLEDLHNDIEYNKQFRRTTL